MAYVYALGAVVATTYMVVSFVTVYTDPASGWRVRLRMAGARLLSVGACLAFVACDGGSVEIDGSGTGGGSSSASSSVSISSASSTGTGGSAPTGCAALPTCVPGAFDVCGGPLPTISCCEATGVAMAACAVPAGMLSHDCGGGPDGGCPSGLCALTLSGSATTCCDVGAVGADGGSADPCEVAP